jgi:excisionase family DNA binding protein
MAHITLKKSHYSPTDIARLTGVSRQTVVKWLKEGRLPATRTPGGHWIIPTNVVEGAQPVERITVNA